MNRLARNQELSTVSSDAVPTSPAFQRHYSVREIATLWQLSEDTVRRLFQNEPGVIEVGQHKQPGKRRAYRTFRIPQSVLERVHQKCSLAE